MLCICGLAKAQDNVSNIRVQQADEHLIIMYDLTEKADIEIHVSFDGGATFIGPLQHVSGAVGKGIVAERNKMLTWHVLPEVGEVDYDNVVIKVVATAELPEAPEPEPEPEIKERQKYPPFMISLSAGARPYGNIGMGYIRSGGVAVIDVDMAYFFNAWLGAGIKANMGIAEISVLSRATMNRYGYTDRVLFVGPALHGRFGKGKLALTASVAAGAINWKVTNVDREIFLLLNEENRTTAGGVLSAGLNLMLARNFGISINANSIVTLEGNDHGRKPDAVGATMGLNFRF